MRLLYLSLILIDSSTSKLEFFYNREFLQMNPVAEPIQGLSKRQQNKQQKIAKANDNNKSQTHAKSYKRKAKGKHPQQCAQRKLIKTQAEHSQEQSEQNNFSISYQKDKNDQQQGADRKKNLKLIKPFNPKFKVQGGEEGLFEYIMTYAFTEKTKKSDAPVEDPSFLDQFEGQPLQIMSQRTRETSKNIISAEFEAIKQKIEVPFDETHKSFTRRIAGLSTKNP